MDTLLNGLEIGPLLPSSLSHLILNMFVNVTFAYRRHTIPVSPCIGFPPSAHFSLPLASNHSHSFYYLYTDDSHTWSQRRLALNSGCCLYNLLVVCGVWMKKEKPSG